MSYWDSSALVKLYVQETDSSVFEHYAASAQSAPTTARLSFYELRTVLQRKEFEGSITPGAAHSIYNRVLQDSASGSIRVVEFSLDVAREFENVVIRCFGHPTATFLRTLDGIHLASAILARETEFVATDKRLRDAASLLGLKVFP